MTTMQTPSHIESPLQIGLDIVVNGDPCAIPPDCDLARLVERLGHREDGVATAVNGDFVARARRRGHALRAGDQVHCFQLIVGG